MKYYNESVISELSEITDQLRLDVIEMITRAGSGHPGGSLSAAEIMAVLFFHKLKLNSEIPTWEDRDRFILSKGHAAPVLYAALARRGFFPHKELLTLRTLGSRLQGHPDRKKTPGVEMTAGALEIGRAHV